MSHETAPMDTSEMDSSENLSEDAVMGKVEYDAYRAKEASDEADLTDEALGVDTKDENVVSIMVQPSDFLQRAARRKREEAEDVKWEARQFVKEHLDVVEPAARAEMERDFSERSDKPA